MRKPQFITPDEAASLVREGATVASGGFVGSGHAEALTAALEGRFLREGAPRNLTLIYAAGQGDGVSRGMNHLGHAGLVRRVIGGHWNLAPKLGRLASEGLVEAYNFPQGVISKLFREIASGNPGLISRIGLGTFVDPRRDGGRLNQATTEPLVELVTIGGQEMLFYRSIPIDVALVRGTSSDCFGNVSFEREALTGEVLSIAQAARNSGGITIVQVERIVDAYSRDPKQIRLPGIFVDYVVVSEPGTHHQTYACEFDERLVRQGAAEQLLLPPLLPGPRRWIAARCFEELGSGDVVNLGIGIPEGVAQIAQERGALNDLVLTVESGAVGGIPAGGLSFGAAYYPAAIIDQPYMFDFYDGGGIDAAVLSMAECDANGDVNVSRYGGKLPGAGGFINIAQRAKRVVFAGTFTASGLDVRFSEGRLEVVSEGSARKFVPAVGHVTFSADTARKDRQEVLYVTERAVFRLASEGLELIELAPGLDVEAIRGQMGFAPKVSASLRIMDPACFA